MGNLIIGTGSYVPEKVVTNEDLLRHVDLSKFDEKKSGPYPVWVKNIMGFEERRIASPNQATSDLAFEASIRALDNANISAKDIDLIILSTSTPDKKAPNTASILQAKLGVGSGSAAFDILHACPGFVFGLHTADAIINNGDKYQNVLVVGAEKMSSIVDFRNYITGATFGDGAGAVVLRKSDKHLYGILSSYIKSDGKRGELLDIPAGGTFMPITPDNIEEVYDKGLHCLQMSAKEVKGFATQKLEEAVRYVLRKESLGVEDICYVLPHQASSRFIANAVHALGLSDDRVLKNYYKYGNTSQASIPILLDENKALFKNRDLLILAAMGGGLGWGALIYSWFDQKSKPKNVIVIDDEPGKAEVLAAILDDYLINENYPTRIEFDIVDSGEKFVEKINSIPTKYDLAIVDQRMPGMSGLEAIMTVQRIQPDLRCMILTGQATKEDFVMISNYKNVDIMLKPFGGPDESNYKMFKNVLERVD